jgi:hypothetical protein
MAEANIRVFFGRLVATVIVAAPSLVLAGSLPAAETKKAAPKSETPIVTTMPSDPVVFKGELIRSVLDDFTVYGRHCASPYEPPGQPPDRPPHDPPGHDNPPNPPGQPPDRPPHH